MEDAVWGVGGTDVPVLAHRRGRVSDRVPDDADKDRAHGLGGRCPALGTGPARVPGPSPEGGTHLFRPVGPRRASRMGRAGAGLPRGATARGWEAPPPPGTAFPGLMAPTVSGAARIRHCPCPHRRLRGLGSRIPPGVMSCVTGTGPGSQSTWPTPGRSASTRSDAGHCERARSLWHAERRWERPDFACIVCRHLLGQGRPGRQPKARLPNG